MKGVSKTVKIGFAYKTETFHSNSIEIKTREMTKQWSENWKFKISHCEISLNTLPNLQPFVHFPTPLVVHFLEENPP